MPVGRSHPLERRTLTMHRRTKPVPLARMDLNRLIRTLRQRSTSEWPRHLSSALEVLTVELKVDRQTALELLIASVSAAHRCACAVEQRALARSRARARADVHKALLLIAKCAARSPAALRRSLLLGRVCSRSWHRRCRGPTASCAPGGSGVSQIPQDAGGHHGAKGDRIS